MTSEARVQRPARVTLPAVAVGVSEPDADDIDVIAALVDLRRNLMLDDEPVRQGGRTLVVSVEEPQLADSHPRLRTGSMMWWKDTRTSKTGRVGVVGEHRSPLRDAWAAAQHQLSSGCAWRHRPIAFHRLVLTSVLWRGRDTGLPRCRKPTKPTTAAATRIAPARSRASSKPLRKDAVARSSACWPADAATWT